jgi:hypothetical protein
MLQHSNRKGIVKLLILKWKVFSDAHHVGGL